MPNEAMRRCSIFCPPSAMCHLRSRTRVTQTPFRFPLHFPEVAHFCLGSKADMCGAQPHVRLGPKPDSCTAQIADPVRRNFAAAPASRKCLAERCGVPIALPSDYQALYVYFQHINALGLRLLPGFGSNGRGPVGGNAIAARKCCEHVDFYVGCQRHTRSKKSCQCIPPFEDRSANRVFNLTVLGKYQGEA